MRKILINSDRKVLGKADGKIYGISTETEGSNIEGVRIEEENIIVDGNTLNSTVKVYDTKNVGIYGKDSKVSLYNDCEVDNVVGKVTAENLIPDYIAKDVTILGVTGIKPDSVAGVSVSASMYGSRDLTINGNVIENNNTGIVIENYKGKMLINNPLRDSNDKIELNIGGYANVNLVDSHAQNIIISTNLSPENIKKDVNILGTVGTFESESIEGVSVVDGKLVIEDTNMPVQITGSDEEIEIKYSTKQQKIKIGTYSEIYLADESQYNVITAPNLEPQNIAKDVNILGVVGTYECGGSGSNESTLKKCLDARKSAEYLFAGARDITDLTGILEYNDTEKVSSINYIFEGCAKLKTIPEMNLQNVQNMGYAFDGCNSLETLHLEKLIGVEYTFSSCYKLKKLDIDSWETDWIDYEFSSCHSLKALIIRSFEIDPYDIYGEEVFGACYHLSGTQNSTYNPTGARDGYIYVPSEYVEALQENEIFSQFADQIRALEDYTVDGTTTGKFDDALAGLN